MSTKEVRTFTYPNAIVNVFIPDLDEEERNKRIEQIKRTAENLLKEGVRNESI